MKTFGSFCSHCGGDRGKREPADSDGLGCLDNIYHSEDSPQWECPDCHAENEADEAICYGCGRDK